MNGVMKINVGISVSNCSHFSLHSMHEVVPNRAASHAGNSKCYLRTWSSSSAALYGSWSSTSPSCSIALSFALCLMFLMRSFLVLKKEYRDEYSDRSMPLNTYGFAVSPATDFGATHRSKLRVTPAPCRANENRGALVVSSRPGQIFLVRSPP